MPLLIYQSNLTNTGRLLVWKTTENLGELEAMIKWTDDLAGQYEMVRLEKRKREWLTARILLQLILPGAHLQFASTGKPYLNGNRYISISHCGDLAGIVVADHEVGLDIQGTDEKLEKIAARFCHPKELTRAMEQSDYLEYITMIWSAKEAVFKFFGEQVTFNEDMVIRPFLLTQEELICDYAGVHGERLFQLQHIQMRGYHIVMTVGG